MNEKNTASHIVFCLCERFALGHSIAMTLFICVLTYLQATVWQWMLP